MDSFIKKIFDKKSDLFVHVQFQKFSRGEFKSRAVIKATHTSKGFSIATTYEYANEMVIAVAEKIPNGKKVRVTGIVVSTRDLTGELDFENKKQFMGVKQYVINKDMSKEEIIEICHKFLSSFVGLSFSIDDTELKIKAKSPKSSKPSTKSGEKPNPDFCKLNTTDKNLVKNILFDINLDEFKKAEISHEFLIKDLILPKGEKDSSKIRELTQRKGVIFRKTNVDEKETIKEKNFVA